MIKWLRAAIFANFTDKINGITHMYNVLNNKADLNNKLDIMLGFGYPIFSWDLQPCLDYACSAWANCSEGSKFSLLRLQKRAARIVLKNCDYKNSSGVELIKCLGWQSLEQRRDYYLATQMYKRVHGCAPKLLCDMIVMASDINVRNTRNTDSLNVYIPKPNIECY